MTGTTRPTVHILGFGSMGTVLALDLLRYTNANVIPLFRSNEKVELFQKEANNVFGMKKLYLTDAPLITAQVEQSESPESFSGVHIDNIVITTKTYQTKDALKPYLPYIDSKTNMVLIQNGLGVLELLKEEIFLDEKTRPQLFQGVISHGVYQDVGFIYNHAGFAGMKCSRLPWDDTVIQTKSFMEKDLKDNELVRLFMSKPMCEEFGMEFMTYQEMLSGQLFKFLVNSCINPVTATVDAVNGEIGNSCEEIFSLIIEESLQILKVVYKPLFDYELNYNGKPDYPTLEIESVFNLDNLVKKIIHIGCVINKKNSSSMRQDTLYLRDIEIEYINGYVVRLAEKFKLGADAAKVNKTVSAFAKLRLGLNRTRKVEGDKR
ncbi:hypothetical protein Kpol_543p77 [Vanderwaltozyma polyspora DSM 70294]|uniref:2-dehydropantoate 2-reductase n=1 Tax=Vanderwaltozyma polyspora (strain ATCC 22028 / DSM 70294 / BCRC 21397 / CBS 2163 / NBRC 10782 / NRRL Y-8283 / UCD 57-17) TaxID=436907 RepID=A7THT2_VANPO|nr:uncharacterized protein Kpol_543p77 [Vanderwaltozyma polyspora DSM 70294]EDO18248.1 hypothetical protein Kpol_543p77 [Vanderwaltozyma polyspora DSM 70294]